MCGRYVIARAVGDLVAATGAVPDESLGEADTERLIGKFRAGAEFAVTQLFLEPEGFLRLRDRVAAAGFDQALVPGIMPLTSEKTFHKGPELSGSPLPEALVERLAPYSGDAKAFRAAGMEVTGELCERLIAEGVPGIHFYSLNRSTATTELVERLGLAPRRGAADRAEAVLPV